MSPTQVAVAQDDSASASLTFDCGTAIGPIEIQLESPPTGVSVARHAIGDCGSPMSISLHTSGATPPGTHAFNLGARPNSGRWFVTPMWLIVDSGARFFGDFTTADGNGGFSTWGYSATDDRCEWYVIWEGTIEIEFTDTTPHYVDHPKTNSFKLNATRRSIALQEEVGETICASTTRQFSGTEMFRSMWPQLEVVMRFQTASQPTIGYDVLTFRGSYQPNWREMNISIGFGFDRPDAGGSGTNIQNRIPRID